MRRFNFWQGDRMTRRQVGEEVRSLPMRWVEEAQSQAGRLDYKETGHDVRFLAVRWVRSLNI